MFVRTPIRCAVSTFVQFIKEQAKSKTLKGLPIAERGRQLGQLFKALSPKDKAALASRAKNTNYLKPKEKKRVVRSPYLQFVKANSAKFRNEKPADRLRKIAKLWNEKKGNKK